MHKRVLRKQDRHNNNKQTKIDRCIGLLTLWDKVINPPGCSKQILTEIDHLHVYFRDRVSGKVRELPEVVSVTSMWR